MQVIEAGDVKKQKQKHPKQTNKQKTDFSIVKSGFLSPSKIKKNDIFKSILGADISLCILGEMHKGLKRKMKTIRMF